MGRLSAAAQGDGNARTAEAPKVRVELPTFSGALGAREYDPITGRFISVDPEIDLNDPQQSHGYTYGNNNPVTNSDPTGRMLEECHQGLIECEGGMPVLPDDDPAPPPPSGGGDPIEDFVNEVIDSGWGTQPAGSQRKFFNVGKGANRGVIRITFYIHTKEAMLGMLVGDNRKASVDPHAPYRMSLFWNTESGECSFTVAASHTPTTERLIGGDTGHLQQPRTVPVPGRMIPANPLKVGGISGDTWGG
ncbi:RHS repeat-associated core domain-containing protein [Streptomyces formicae]|uniref:RHS repeat-associated core domain-containing protein n=1 Tax=Streptomyces formicae TaxID=1616117 RepID=A0ABY3WWY4_9ACTN|nr:RHS repeat-associated core domain-containing protein [Streptomyces formicae]UNM15006.1 hypothetical protein J4032_29230 [Streptomyces formicae]